MSSSNEALPVVIIGAGPVGLAAAAQVLERGMTPLVLEAGPVVGHALRQWAHIRMFSPWEYNVDRSAAALLQRSGWEAPDPAQFPTGGELVARYLEPLAATPELAPHLRFGARVTGVAKHGRDLMKHAGRDTQPWLVRYETTAADGNTDEHDVLARAVIDASGTLHSPNPLGASGLPARGERAALARIVYGMPDVLGGARRRYAGKRVLVVGSGHSAFNVLTDLARLPGATIEWAVRRPSLRRVLGGGENDKLKERGLLGLRIARLVEEGAVRLHAGVQIDRIEQTAGGLVAWSGGQALPAVDEIVATTGFRPDRALLAEVRLDLDPGTEAPSALAPLIDPNLHSCGTVRPHGALELRHHDAGLYEVGMKSYGRAPTFLLLTGYEQVRSVAAAIAGDWDAAQRVELVLPETGVCSTQFEAEEAAGCCGGPAPAGVDACCVSDAVAKEAGASGCGCPETGTAPVQPAAADTPAPVAAATPARSATSATTATSAAAEPLATDRSPTLPAGRCCGTRRAA